MRNSIVTITLGCVLLFSSFTSLPGDDEKQPKTVTKTSTLVDGKKVEKTVILLDKNTSREDLIHTCNFLAKENVQLTFDKLSIGKRYLGLLGRQRIRIAEGAIKLKNGASQRFKAGGVTGFKTLKIQYSTTGAVEASQIEMIEIVD